MKNSENREPNRAVGRLDTVPTATIALDETPTGEHPVVVIDPPPVVVPTASFDDFYRRCYVDIVRTLGFTLGDVELATEAADEAMARTYARWATVSTYDNPAGWTYRVGLNWARSVHRRLARQLPVFRKRDTLEPEFTDPAIAEALRSLDTDLRAVVVLRLYADWSVAETAEALGIKPGTVKSRLHRALAILETRLHDHPEVAS